MIRVCPKRIAHGPRALSLLVIAGALVGRSGLAQTAPLAQDSPPYAAFENSTLTGSGNSIVASWVPVVTSNGTVYQNVTILFDVDVSGNLTVASGYPQVVKAPAILISNFHASEYLGPSPTGYKLNVSGPGVTKGGATEWSLAATTSACPNSATWYVGPLRSNPNYPRIKKAGITSSAWYYGVGEGFCSNWFGNNALLGFSQVGNTLTIVNFTNGAGQDIDEPQANLVYTLSPPSN